MIIFKNFELDSSVEFDEVVDLSWNCINLKNVMCCDFMGNVPSVKNIRNGNIEFYTFTDMWDKNMIIDLSGIKIAANGLTIVDDFLLYVSSQLKNTSSSNVVMSKYPDISAYLNYKFKNNWDSNFSSFLNTISINNNSSETNLICSDLLERMLIYVPDRFRYIKTLGIVNLPLVVGDYFYVIYTINYMNYIRKYMIRIILV